MYMEHHITFKSMLIMEIEHSLSNNTCMSLTRGLNKNCIFLYSWQIQSSRYLKICAISILCYYFRSNRFGGLWVE